MKILNLETNEVMEITDKRRFEKLKGYPDKFKVLEEEKPKKEETKTEKRKEKTFSE